jgi:hypothetical protein
MTLTVARERLMRHKSVLVISVVAVTLAASLLIQFKTTADAQLRSLNNGETRIRKNKAQKALLQAMELNARAEAMIKQGVNEPDKMMQFLDQSYSLQAVAIGEMEGVNRVSKFKDPTVAKSIQDMYDNGKPETMKARGSISVGAFDVALEHLARAKLTHQRFLIITY